LWEMSVGIISQISIVGIMWIKHNGKKKS
jgi:hypothetical protein